ncbi:FAD-dependent monooxygenase [Mesorhizobium yinganensis]|uniref:FAD-dependent monooxygenase n=1 Tax=Mesorhizobium yinganensis TaxID=3157707 RepID=UPI0032B80DD8
MALQVLVAGAGPVGLTMASELARFGVSVRVVDKASQRTDKSKALVLWPRTLELLQELAPVDDFIAAGQKVVTANMWSGGASIAHIHLDVVKSPYPYALMVPQSETERVLEERLGSLRLAVERQVELVRFEERGEKVASVLRHADGREETVESDWLVGCDGAHSAVRHGLGMEFEGDTIQNDFVLADIHVSGMRADPPELNIYLHREGVLVFFPITSTRYRVIADLGEAKGERPADPTLPHIQAIIDQRGPGSIAVSDPIWLSAFRINERKVRDYRRGRVFLAGDAAHVHSPAGGQGMNTGMQDAFNLAWKLALACRNICGPDVLDSYSSERSLIGDRVLADAGRLTAIATIRNPILQTVRNTMGHMLLGLAPLREAMAGKLTEVSIGYPGSPLNGQDAGGLDGPAPGDRIAPTADGTRWTVGDAPRFMLFAEAGDDTERLCLEFPDLLDRKVRPALHDGGLWLARPDGYTAAATRAGNIAVLADYLRALRPRSESVSS